METSKTVMFVVCYARWNLNMKKKAKLCYMYTESLKVFTKTEHVFIDIANQVGKRSDTSNYKIDRPKENNKNATG